MTPKTMLTQCLFFAVVLILSGSSAADDEAPERATSLIGDGEGGHFSFVSSSTDFSQNDRYNVDFDNGEIEVSYVADLTTATAQDWSCDLQFEGLVSFADNGNGYLDSGDNVLSTIELEDMSYSVSTWVENTPQGFEKSYISATSEDGLLTLEFVTTPRETSVGSTQLLPTEVKLNISIHGMPLDEGADRVALEMTLNLESDMGAQFDQSGDEGVLNLTALQSGGYFKWSDTALVDGTSQPVKATWSDSKLVFSYPAGEDIKHDPVLGVDSLAAQSGLVVTRANAPIFAIGLIVASALVGGAIILAVRRRKS